MVVDGAVADNAANIAENAQAIAELEGTIAEAVEALGRTDDAIDERLVKVEAFFEGAAKDSEGLNDALDKLVDIQTYLQGDGSATSDLLGKVASNAEAIEDLFDIVGEAGTLTNEVAENAQNISKEVDDRVKAINDVTKTVTDLDAAYKEADLALSGRIDTLVNTTIPAAEQAAKDYADNQVKTLTEGAVAENASNIAELVGRVDSAEDSIDAIQAIVSAEGGNSNAQLRTDINTLKAIVVDGADSNEALRIEVDDIAAKVNDSATGLAKTKEIADGAASAASENAQKIAAIEDDYLKEADLFIFDCGSATKVIHDCPAKAE